MKNYKVEGRKEEDDEEKFTYRKEYWSKQCALRDSIFRTLKQKKPNKVVRSV